MANPISEISNFNSVKIKYLFDQNRTQITPEQIKDISVFHYSIPNVQEYNSGKLEDGIDILSNKFLVESEQLLVSKLNPRKSTVCIASAKKNLTVCSTEFISLIPKTSKVELKFSFYVFLMSETADLLNSMVESVTKSHQRVQPEKFENLYFFVPPIKEQKQMVKYLDQKTQHIDALIEKTQRRIHLLKEQQTAAINHFITKGLDPSIKMKDSGIEWIGEIPEHWEVKKIRHIAQIKRGSSPRPIDDPKYFDENGEFSWVRIADVSLSDKYLFKTKEKLSELGASLSTKMYAGDLFLSIAGSVGKPIISKINCCIHDGFVWFDNYFFNKDYLYYIFLLGTCFHGLGKLGTQLNLNTDTVGDVYIPVPDEYEQQLIVEKIINYLDYRIHLSQLEQSRLNLLSEYRQSLISNVVTGKVRVPEAML